MFIALKTPYQYTIERVISPLYIGGRVLFQKVTVNLRTWTSYSWAVRLNGLTCLATVWILFVFNKMVDLTSLSLNGQYDILNINYSHCESSFIVTIF